MFEFYFGQLPINKARKFPITQRIPERLPRMSLTSQLYDQYYLHIGDDFSTDSFDYLVPTPLPENIEKEELRARLSLTNHQELYMVPTVHRGATSHFSI